MIGGDYEFPLRNLEKLYVDLEKQMLKFDEVLPYGRQNTSEIYSPRLVNMMLACGPQIESITKLISQKCNFPDKPVPNMIQKINEKGVLSHFEIFSIPHKLLFTPFTRDLSWWTAYNKLKHGLTKKQFELTYSDVMDAFSALTALYCLANSLSTDNDKYVQQILDKKTWINIRMLLLPNNVVMTDRYRGEYITYKSLIFEIRSILNLPSNS